jgi:hypothetical protein
MLTLQTVRSGARRLNSLAPAHQALQPLVGLPLSIVRNVVGMRVFHFGEIRPHHGGKGTVGEYALHVQCPWRLVGVDGLITGSADRDEPPRLGAKIDRSDPQNGCLQDVRLAALLGGFDPVTHSHTNVTEGLVVITVGADGFGSAEISLSGEIRLQLFPDGSLEEDWRFFETSDQGAHFVIEGGRVAPG